MYNKNKSKTYGNYGKNFSTSASRNREVKKETRNYYRSNSTPVPQRQRSQGVNHRGLRYDYDPAFSHVGSHSKDVSFRNRASLASITESEIGARTEYEDQQFNRMLERNFKQLKLQERLAKEKSKRMFRQQKILDAKLKDYENKKSKEAKLWLEAYNRITPDGVTGSRTGLKSLDQVVRNMSMIKVPRKEAEEEAATLVEENERVGIEKVLAEKEGETRNTNVDESATLLESKISFAGKTIPKDCETGARICDKKFIDMTFC